MSFSWAQRISEERLKSGMNQSDFARLGGVSRRSQADYEAGKVPPNLDYIAKLRESGVDVGYVVTGARDTGDLSIEEGRLLDALRAIGEEWCDLVVKMVEKIRDERPETIHQGGASFRHHGREAE